METLPQRQGPHTRCWHSAAAKDRQGRLLHDTQKQTLATWFYSRSDSRVTSANQMINRHSGRGLHLLLLAQNNRPQLPQSYQLADEPQASESRADRVSFWHDSDHTRRPLS